MTKRDPLSQAQKLEEKIKQMQNRQKHYIEKAQKEIGQYLMDTWDIEDIDQAKEVIDSLKGNAQQYFENESKDVQEKTEVLNENNG
ncbi:hypothetical protein [Halobacillus amylolyticus]|uniref:Uncharacterized protein n=1 Tax=Halobacillus amylolyticus TaxID=2932259 RepID=A0ABY4HI77_9BACI|nr:hypothetical protein [Halobacillus amylolyticus]UOR14097.1 hypothetical protein MUO15_21310 [Halobacillus amylolyticus]